MQMHIQLAKQTLTELVIDYLTLVERQYRIASRGTPYKCTASLLYDHEHITLCAVRHIYLYMYIRTYGAGFLID